MSYAFGTVLTAAQQMFSDLIAAKVLELGNAAHAKICRHVKLYPDDVVLVPVQANVRTQGFDKDILRAWSAYLYTGPTAFQQLQEWSEDEGDYKEFGIRGAVPGTPFRWFQQGSMFGVDPTPNVTTPTIAISGATSARPIVLTSAAHGLSSSNDGTPANAVTVQGVGGLLSANGAFYAKVTGYSGTTLALYQDQALTIPIDGTGGPAYTSGGTLITPACYPVIQIYCQKRRVLALTDSLPAQVLYYDAWTDEIAYQWAKQRHRDLRDDFRKQARDSLNALSWEIMGRPVRLKPQVAFHTPPIRG